MMRAAHLALRFTGALWPGPPRAADQAWVAEILTADELRLWSRMVAHDRRHAVRVARSVEKALAGSAHGHEPAWLVAALLHDVGKLDASLGVLGRVGATLAGALGGHEIAGPWSGMRGTRRRVGLYLRHGELGADRIRVVGGREEAARWASAHHDPDAWASLGFPVEVVAALQGADHD